MLNKLIHWKWQIFLDEVSKNALQLELFSNLFKISKNSYTSGFLFGLKALSLLHAQKSTTIWELIWSFFRRLWFYFLGEKISLRRRRSLLKTCFHGSVREVLLKLLIFLRKSSVHPVVDSRRKLAISNSNDIFHSATSLSLLLSI